MYTLLQYNTGMILQSNEASEDRPAYGAKFEKFKRDSENQIVTNSTNDISRSIRRQDSPPLVQSER